MSTMSVLQALEEHFTVRRVFGDAYERDGVTVVPVAAVYGGGGGGGERGEGAKDAEGMGFGMIARPVGAYVISGGTVRWEPAFDLNRAVIGGQVLGMAVLSLARLVVKRRAKRRR